MRDDNVGVALGWFYELLMHRAYRFHVLADDALYVAAALGDIPLHTADETHIRRGIDKNLERHQIAQIGIIQSKQAFDHDDRCGLHEDGAVGAVIDREVVLRHRNRFAIAQGLDVLHQQRPVESLRVIVVLPAAFFRAEMGLVAVVIVLHHHRDHIGAKRREHLLGYRRLTTAAAASDTNYKWMERNLVHAE